MNLNTWKTSSPQGQLTPKRTSLHSVILTSHPALKRGITPGGTSHSRRPLSPNLWRHNLGNRLPDSSSESPSDPKCLFKKPQKVWPGIFSHGSESWNQGTIMPTGKDQDTFICRKNGMRDHHSPANIWAMHPKLSGVLHLQEARVSKTPNGGRSAMQTVRTQSCDNQVHVKAAGEALGILLRVMLTPQTSETVIEDGPAPPEPFKSEEQVEKPRRDLSGAKPISNSREINTEYW